MKTFAENRRAFFDYEILEKHVAGVILTGHETKSIKMGRVQIAGAHIIIRENEGFVVGMNISSFQPKNAPADHDPERTKKLLLRRDEIKYLLGKIKTGLTIIPLRVFQDNGFVKVEIGLAKGLKKWDRRELVKKREAEREIRRTET